ncbi:MAG: autotransporter-associated beta strand repeat-containing protein [Opitutaceae bacterium]|nr:autotransporter-associated beta strand repeat-containing protein [Opitutaceae bacterium]
MKLRVQLIALVGVMAGAWPVSAQTFVWSPTAATGVFELNTNWAGSVAPTAGGALSFSSTTQSSLTLSATINVASVTFDGSGGSLSYSFNSSNGAVLRPGSGGITMPNTSAGSIQFGSGLGVELTANQTWNLGGGSWSLDVAGNITGAFSLRKTGDGGLSLSGANTYSGGMTINNGSVNVLTSGALGPATSSLAMVPTGTATWAGLYISSGVTQTIGALTLGGSDAVANGGNSIWIDSTGRLNLGGDVTYDAINGPSSTYFSGGTIGLPANRKFQIVDSANAYSEVYIDSVIDGVGGLIKSGSGVLQLNGVNTYAGGTTVNGGTLRLGANNALPNTAPAGNVVVNANAAFPATLEIGTTSQSIGSLTFGGSDATARLPNQVTMWAGSLTLGGSVTVTGTNGPAGALIDGGTLNLGAATSRVFTVGDSSNAARDLSVTSIIAGTGGMTKDGLGTLFLAGQSTFAGGLALNAGTLVLGATTTKDTSGAIVSGPVGRGTLTLASGTTLVAPPIFTTTTTTTTGTTSEIDINIANAVLLATNVTLGSTLSNANGNLTFSGPVTATSTATTVNVPLDNDVFFTGTLNGATAATTLTFGSGGVAVLAGTTGANISAINADNSAVVIASSSAIPTSVSLKATNSGYIGVVATTLAAVPSAAAVLGRITDRAGFAGTLGFDTDFDALTAPNVFSDNLDLTGFGSNFSLGSLSMAIISGTITPPAAGYVFGKGGGALIVRSSLADVGGSKPVIVNSTGGAPLVAVFQGNNTFTGNMSVTNSVAVLDSAGALPTGGSVALGANGYLGYTESFTAVSSLAALGQRVSSFTNTSILGLDSHQFIGSTPFEPPTGSSPARIVTETIDLSGRSAIYLGTTTHAVVLGSVLAPNQGGANRTLSLIAVSRGLLEMRSALTSANVGSVVIGSTTTPFQGGRVVLAGSNTYTGGTTLNSGVLLLEGGSWRSGSSILGGPLGTGTLTVPNSAQSPVLGSADWAYIDNPIALGGPLQLGGVLHNDDPNSYYNWITLNGIISDITSQVGSLHVRGSAQLGGANTFSGGVFLEAGDLHIGHNSALGTGDLTLNPMAEGPGSYGYVGLSLDAARTISNRVVLNSSGNGYLSIWGGGSLTVTGAVVLNGNVEISPYQNPLYLNGPISGSAPLVAGGNKPVVVNSTSNTYTGATITNWGSIIFGSGAAIPSTTLLLSNYNGYIGVASPTFASSLQTNFLNRFDKPATTGTIGFDTLDTAAASNTFTGAIDLRGFGWDARLGTATRAILSGAITPQGTSYNFGGGGGMLDVNTVLADAATAARRVWVNSTDSAPLTVRLGGANTHTGGTEVDSSGLIFKTGALPGTGSLNASSGGYIGTEDSTLGATPANFIGRFDATMQDGIIGFDAASGSHLVTGALSLTRFTSTDTTTDPRIFLGSSTSATFSGTITLPALQNAYRFAGYKGGQVTVTSVLDGARSVEIGDRNTPATFRSPNDPSGPLSSVTLSAANTYSGGTTLFGGALGIGNNAALGLSSGTLTVDQMWYYFDFGNRPLLFASGGARTVANPIRLKAHLDVGGTESLTLSGVISADATTGGSEPYRIYKTGSGTVTFSGANTFAGGISVEQGTAAFTSLNAAGTGQLEIGGTAATLASFLENANVNGISGYNNLGLIQVAAGKTLTVSQAGSSSYYGQFSLGTGASLVFGGPYPATPTTLYLYGSSSFTGSTKIQSGVRVVAGVNQAFGATTNTVTLDGGILAVESGVTLSNPLTLNSGVLAGGGTFQPGGTLSIKTGLALSPGGGHGTGTLTFASTALSLENGGVYRWQLPDVTGNWDQIDVTGAVAINAPTTPFTFKIVPAGSLDLIGSVTNFDPTVAQSWAVLNATSITLTGTLQSAFTFDTTEVISNIGVGSFSLSLITSAPGMSLLLNFTPVPEPSTYALLGIGVVVLMWSQRRRRR